MYIQPGSKGLQYLLKDAFLTYNPIFGIGFNPKFKKLKRIMLHFKDNVCMEFKTFYYFRITALFETL